MQSDKNCFICGKPGIAKANGRIWLCEQHALEAAEVSLAMGAPVIWAQRGNPQYLMMPAVVNKN